MMNSSNAKFKLSKLERQTNKQIIIVFVIQIIFCLIAAAISITMQKTMLEDKAGYLDLIKQEESVIMLLISKTGGWILIFTYAFFLLKSFI